MRDTILNYPEVINQNLILASIGGGFAKEKLIVFITENTCITLLK